MKKIKLGSVAKDMRTGHIGKIIDIQYEHNRFQFSDVSGWQYGIENLRGVAV